jgi:hypothetical protein
LFSATEKNVFVVAQQNKSQLGLQMTILLNKNILLPLMPLWRKTNEK